MAEVKVGDSTGSFFEDFMLLLKNRASKYASTLPVALEISLIGALTWLAYAVLFREQRLKHSAFLRPGRYRVHPGREQPRLHNKNKFFQNSQGLWIHHCKWIKEGNTQPIGLILMLHGHSEHINRHQHVAEYYASKGFVVFGMDHQGFGRSEGDRGHVEQFDHYIDDVMLFFTRVLKADYSEYENLPRFITGHSMGGLITLATALRMQDSPEPWHRLTGVVPGNPALYMNPGHSGVTLLGLRLLAYLSPKMYFLGFPEVESVSFLQTKHHSQYDPLNYAEKMRPHHTLEMLMATRKMHEHANRFETPVFLFHGINDLTVPVEGSREFFGKIKSSDKKLLEIPELMHEPLQEPPEIRDPILEQIVAWMKERSTSATSN
eukprot:CAMPEP_0184006616 /NCGR_PEP_ID=MMETSP0954-20121128/806_1 /TAXON_ID=627963 /ORGANISM="Aplanochytrium sp, Strain PBS07" /LENGTH=376 /DNA_ID=CAMNT_0026285213 /DNA_START=531 /DNA_END=1661 /DNA_ORIENTATION=+